MIPGSIRLSRPGLKSRHRHLRCSSPGPGVPVAKSGRHRIRRPWHYGSSQCPGYRPRASFRSALSPFAKTAHPRPLPPRRNLRHRAAMPWRRVDPGPV